MLTVSANDRAPYMPVVARAAPQVVKTENSAPAPLDPVDLSSFAKVDRNTDAGAGRDLDKKSFKSMKEYVEYMLLMYAKLRDLKAKPGEIHVKMEQQDDLAKARSAIADAELV